MGRGESRGRIQQALFALLEERPIEKITISEVVARAGVSRTTYYRAYYSLDDVIDDALDELFARIEPLIPQGGQEVPADRRLVELSTYQALMCYQNASDMLSPLLRGSARMMVHQRLFDFSLRMVSANGRQVDMSSIDQMEQTYVAAGMAAVISQWLAGNCAEPVVDVLAFIMRARTKGHVASSA